METFYKFSEPELSDTLFSDTQIGDVYTSTLESLDLGHNNGSPMYEFNFDRRMQCVMASVAVKTDKGYISYVSQLFYENPQVIPISLRKERQVTDLLTRDLEIFLYSNKASFVGGNDEIESIGGPFHKKLLRNPEDPSELQLMVMKNPFKLEKADVNSNDLDSSLKFLTMPTETDLVAEFLTLDW